MKHISDKRREALDARPAVATIPEPKDRTAVLRANDEGLQEFVRRLPCAVCKRPSIKVDPCHHKTRERWGDWIEVDGETQGNIWPGCRRHHREQHDRGVRTFEILHRVDLERVAAIVGDAYLAGHEPETLAAAACPNGYEAIRVDDLAPGLDLF